MSPARASRAVADRRSFFSELKRRNVLRAAVLYAGAVWAASQGVSQLTPALGLPDLATRWFLIAAAIGFPFWLAFAWFYEFTPQGLKRESEIAADASITRATGRKLDKWIIAVLALAVVLLLTNTFVWKRGAGLHGDAASSIPAQSIAVLPLVNESGAKDEQYFSDGLSEDLITALSQVVGLKVISRNSSFQFRDTSENSQAIGEKLGVAHLLEGSVQRAGDVVRISASLVNAADGSTLWAQHYDRPYKDLFALQDEITHAVASALKAKLLAGAGAMPQNDRPPSGNLDAWNAFSEARFHESTVNPEDARKTIGFYEQAIASDPRYASAYANLSFVWARLGGTFLAGEEQRQAFAHARVAAERALQLDPDLAAAHDARALVLNWADFDFTGAEAESRRALELAPDQSLAQFQLGMLLGTLGQPRRAVELIRQALTTDPRNGAAWYWLGWNLAAIGQMEEAERSMHKAVELVPKSPFLAAGLVMIQIQRGENEAAARVVPQMAPGNWHDVAFTFVLQGSPDPAAADAALKELIAKQGGGSAYQIAEIQGLRKDPDNMFKWLDRAWDTRDPGIQRLLTDQFILRYKDDPRFAAFRRKVGLPVSAEADH